MAKVPERIFIKPKMVKIAGRAPKLATIPYPSAVGDSRKVLPPEGATVSMEGAARSYWQRRINEGSVEKVEPEPGPTTEPTSVAPAPTEPSAPEPEESAAEKDGEE